ncbi:MAG: Dam family site-specific DNA-(adenine-N6)-methyltransferase [Nitrosopumilus sp.]|nr:Dam family site-specific DNA-(adenine-N6)-methyltransferase [Nitrosopumilus sp.]MDA7943593.1 Dam family site-specific DNA-(adenine-N6)-methyltransferase [Nitrosopumilus sp.]MDA7952840.1 Dam family site-specific DNA-(adenine-N6)-methyltransferase [Nitrosopumilus sp.]MDA7959036.1 Dam family site-specific DNA-(adenine-N6)-methyltransferase [Nitrosopumilus sp.]MDA7998856.1 Dam family site-specific DNA-(adenine-N6)-methyltransferase [Nitrosopumilus sp.]
MQYQVLGAPRPFVKWAGGKRQLLPVLQESLPGSFGAYHEPFLGGGALLFQMVSAGHRRRFLASDLNRDLVDAYVAIRDRIDEMVRSLEAHDEAYRDDPCGYYYRVRDASPRGAIARASRLVFLNRTCFNGLYRVNSRGRFNVPLGRYANPAIVNEGNLRAVSAALRAGQVDIRCRDFGAAIKDARPGDLVYLDPPYQPVDGTGFTSYTSRDFGMDDLGRLAEACRELDGRGCLVMLSNSDSREVSRLFPGWRIRRVRARRAINSDSGGRSGHRELLIRNY